MFLSYPVRDLDAAGQVLRQAGFELAATADDFTIWRGVGGVLVRLTDQRAAPAQQTNSATTTDGPPVQSVTFDPGNSAALKEQLAKALGVRWEPIVQQVDASEEREAHVTLETPDPVQSCTADQTPGHIIYFTPNLVGVEQRLATSGMSFVGRAPGMNTYFRGAGDFYVEVGSTAFELAELVP